MNKRTKTKNNFIDDLINSPKEPNKFVTGLRNLKDNYFLFSSEMADKLPKGDVEKVYRANGEGGLFAMVASIPLYALSPIGTAAALALTYAGGKGVYNASRLRERYMEEVMHAKPNKQSRLYNFGRDIKRFTEGIF